MGCSPRCRQRRCPAHLAAGLTQTLNEFRQTTQQLQRLQSHEVRRLQAVERDQGAGARRPPSVPEEAPPPAEQANGTGAASDGGSASPAAAASSSPRSPAVRARSRSVSGSPGGLAAAAVPAQPSAQAAAGLRLAEQLEDVAGGAESGLLAEAAVALRELSARDAQLAAKEAEVARLRGEVEELNDTMFSKTFKPPSAWAGGCRAEGRALRGAAAALRRSVL